MKVTKIYCDKCSSEIFIDGSSVLGLDFCGKCSKPLLAVIQKWINGAEQEEIEAMAEVVLTEPKKAGRRSNIDWDKACELKEAGWSNSNIADMLCINVETVNACIYKKLEERRNGNE